MRRADPSALTAPAGAGRSGTALAATGERAGWYAVECGYPGPEGPVLLETQTGAALDRGDIFTYLPGFFASFWVDKPRRFLHNVK